jgi:hypothetical protein
MAVKVSPLRPVEQVPIGSPIVPSVLLVGPAGELRRVSISHLLAAPGIRISETRDGDDTRPNGHRQLGGAVTRTASFARTLYTICTYTLPYIDP